MYKKLIAALCALTLMFTLSAAAAGGGTQAGGTSQNGSGGSDSTATLSQLRNSMQQIRQNSLQSQIQTATNSELREQCRLLIGDLQAQNGTLSEEALGELVQLRAQVQALYNDLAATQGEIRQSMLQYRSGRLDRDYPGMQEDLDCVLATQQTRLQLKEQINEKLQQMVNLLTPAE
jgi:hypothetical protein